MDGGTRDGLAGTDRVTAHYRALVAAGEIAEDPAQLALAEKLDRLNRRLGERRLAAKGSALGWLFAAKAAEPVRGTLPDPIRIPLLTSNYFAVCSRRSRRSCRCTSSEAEAARPVQPCSLRSP